MDGGKTLGACAWIYQVFYPVTKKLLTCYVAKVCHLKFASHSNLVQHLRSNPTSMKKSGLWRSLRGIHPSVVTAIVLLNVKTEVWQDIPGFLYTHSLKTVLFCVYSSFILMYRVIMH